MADSKKNNFASMESYANKTCHGRWMSEEYKHGLAGDKPESQEGVSK